MKTKTENAVSRTLSAKPSQWERWKKAAKKKGKRLSPWAVEVLESAAIQPEVKP